MFDNHAICKDQKAPSTALIKLGNTVYRLVAIENFFFFWGGGLRVKRTMQWHRIELRNMNKTTEFDKNNNEEKEINNELSIEAF